MLKLNNFERAKIRVVLEVYQYNIRGELDMDSGKVYRRRVLNPVR